MPGTTPPPAVQVAAVPPAPRPTAALPADASCVTPACHARFATARQVHGPVGAGECLVCHQPDQGDHRYPLKRSQEETCTFCHRVTGVQQFVHQAVTDAKAGCIACHDPHASDSKYLLAGATVSQTCAKCHQVELKKHTHGPVAQGQCTLCHLPHEADNAQLLRGGAGNAHCLTCHEDLKLQLASAPHVHQPAKDQCTTCHNAHASDYPRMLATPVKDNCYTCHEQLQKTVASASNPHQAVFTGKQCGNCHDPHAAGRDHLLKARVDNLCLTCHNQEIQSSSGRVIANMEPLLKDRKFLHGPVKAGQCDACHNAHGAAHSRLLRENFTEAFYADFDESIYALCFTCHDQQLVETEKTTTLTGFRNGAQNLHYVHVHRDRKGRTCRTCHAIHASNLPRHMATDVPFEGSGWAMPIKFQATADGGSCSPGCHEPYAYHRGKDGDQ